MKELEICLLTLQDNLKTFSTSLPKITSPIGQELIDLAVKLTARSQACLEHAKAFDKEMQNKKNFVNDKEKELEMNKAKNLIPQNVFDQGKKEIKDLQSQLDQPF